MQWRRQNFKGNPFQQLFLPTSTCGHLEDEITGALQIVSCWPMQTLKQSNFNKFMGATYFTVITFVNSEPLCHQVKQRGVSSSPFRLSSIHVRFSYNCLSVHLALSVPFYCGIIRLDTERQILKIKTIVAADCRKISVASIQISLLYRCGCLVTRHKTRCST